jgi:hypothetical protein
MQYPSGPQGPPQNLPEDPHIPLNLLLQNLCIVWSSLVGWFNQVALPCEVETEFTRLYRYNLRRPISNFTRLVRSGLAARLSKPGHSIKQCFNFCRIRTCALSEQKQSGRPSDVLHLTYTVKAAWSNLPITQ